MCRLTLQRWGVFRWWGRFRFHASRFGSLLHHLLHHLAAVGLPRGSVKVGIGRLQVVLGGNRFGIP
ncbi:MAG: hypothetical protein IT427_07405 [Pirellulales bacterium]|nr:hypothetical protein [Pirellulales bacterium]